jgi:hypothetical protein
LSATNSTKNGVNFKGKQGWILGHKPMSVTLGLWPDVNNFTFSITYFFLLILRTNFIKLNFSALCIFGKLWSIRTVLHTRLYGYLRLVKLDDNNFWFFIVLFFLALNLFVGNYFHGNFQYYTTIRHSPPSTSISSSSYNIIDI